MMPCPFIKAGHDKFQIDAGRLAEEGRRVGGGADEQHGPCQAPRRAEAAAHPQARDHEEGI